MSRIPDHRFADGKELGSRWRFAQAAVDYLETHFPGRPDRSMRVWLTHLNEWRGWRRCGVRGAASTRACLVPVEAYLRHALKE